eukprot:TRINITY_DN22474_c0_g1_i1.p1 TRINITY_DN22474_c0_g1~~TRINITY_DN22474_c0_g1_i1.p1  ORF type:complete len:665 (-),score=102.81 TRINITY_DN22474_c0_g1_i1:52-2046(-)
MAATTLLRRCGSSRGHVFALAPVQRWAAGPTSIASFVPARRLAKWAGRGVRNNDEVDTSSDFLNPTPSSSSSSSPSLSSSSGSVEAGGFSAGGGRHDSSQQPLDATGVESCSERAKNKENGATVSDKMSGSDTIGDALDPLYEYHQYSGHSDANGRPPGDSDWLDDDDDFDSPYDRDYPENRELLIPQREGALGGGGGRQKRRAHKLTLLQRVALMEAKSAEGRDGDRGRTWNTSDLLQTNRKCQKDFQEGVPIRVRVLDVDALPLSELHHAFAHSLARRRPAEVCLHVASRIAVFRDKYNHQSYENLLRDCGRLFGPTHGPELVALLARCYATISVPFLIDYTRRYGQFSKAYIAKQVAQSLRPGFFDFLRYDKNGGVRPLPLVVSKPWSLSAYTRLLAKSSIKSQLHEQLKIHGAIPQTTLEADTAELSMEARTNERLSAATSLRVRPPEVASAWPEAPKGGAPTWRAKRPALLDVIMEAEYSGRGWDAAAAEAASRAVAGPASEDRLSIPAVETEGLGLPSSTGRGSPMLDFPENLDDSDEDEADREARERFGLQFEHVVPDDVYEAASQDALTVPEEMKRIPQPSDDFESLLIPDRWWSTRRQAFFRHMHRAYRLTDGGWSEVPDPRGPRPMPKQRHRSRRLKREERMRREMQSGLGADA